MTPEQEKEIQLDVLEKFKNKINKWSVDKLFPEAKKDEEEEMECLDDEGEPSDEEELLDKYFSE